MKRSTRLGVIIAVGYFLLGVGFTLAFVTPHTLVPGGVLMAAAALSIGSIVRDAVRKMPSIDSKQREDSDVRPCRGTRTH